VFALGVATLFVAIGISLIASIENQINARLDQTAAWFGVQFSAFLVPHVLLQTPIGRLSDNLGRRGFVVWGTILAVPAVLAQGYVTTSWGMLAARAAQGVATALFFAPGLAMAGDLSETGTTGTNVSLLTMGFGFGVAVGPLLSGLLVGFGFAAPFVAGAVLGVLAATIVVTQVDETHDPGPKPPAEPAPG
jgi:MFS family permease